MRTKKSFEMERAKLQREAAGYWNMTKSKREIIDKVKLLTQQIKNMNYQSKVYKVIIGFITKKEDCSNWDNVNVVAKDVQEAMTKVKLNKSEYIQEVILESWIDLL